MISQTGKGLLLGMIAVVLLTSTSGCRLTIGNGSPESSRLREPALNRKIEYTLLTHYSNDSERQPVDEAIAEVEKKFPNVTIRPEALANDNGEQFKTRLATGDLPDFVDVNGQTIGNAIASGSIIPLDGFFSSHPEYAASLIPSVVDHQLRYHDGHIYAFPRSGPAVDLLFFNKQLFEQWGIPKPRNYPELLDAVKAFRAKGIVPLSLFAKQAWPIGAFFDMFAMRRNPKGMMAMSDGTTTASDLTFAPAIQKMEELIRNGIFQEDALSADYDTAKSLFLAGKAAMFISGEWDINDMEKHMGDRMDYFDVFPTTDPGDERANEHAMPGGGELGGIAVVSTAPESNLAVQIAAEFTQQFQIASFKMQSSTMITIPAGNLEHDHPLSEMTKRLLHAKSKYIMKSMPEHSLPNKVFAAAFGEELQKFVAGETAEQFISNTDAIIRQSQSK